MVINNFEVFQNGIWTIESADLFWNGHQERVYYAIPTEFSDAICLTNADAFVVGFIQLAAKYNEDIIVEKRPVSKQLMKNIETILIPAFNRMGCGNSAIKIKAENSDDSFSQRNGATGISLGVDSFYSILTNIPQNVKCVLNVLECSNFEEMSSDVSTYDNKNNRKRTVSNQLGCEYIPVLTNMNCILSTEYSFLQTHSFIHLSVAMILMNKINSYYYSTGYADKDFCLDFGGSSHYDVLIRKVLTYSNFKMITSGGDVSRLQKTDFLSSSKFAQKYLDVCLKNDNGTKSDLINCSMCDKCRRTMVTLDILDKLDKFNVVFDVKYYHNHKPWYIGEIIYGAIVMKDYFAIEIYDEMRKKHYKIPLLAWWYFIKRGICNQIRKLKRLVK